MGLLTGGNIANVERVKIQLDGSDTAYVFQTASSASFTPAVSQGTEREQRVKNTLMGLIRTEDLTKGYDINLQDQRLLMEIYSLIDGGTLTMGTGSSAGEWQSYAAPVAGSSVTRSQFTLTLYTSDRDSDGDANEYYSWTFPACKGTPVSGGAQDDDFHTMEYTIRSRPAKGVSPLAIARVDALPAVT